MHPEPSLVMLVFNPIGVVILTAFEPVDCHIV